MQVLEAVIAHPYFQDCLVSWLQIFLDVLTKRTPERHHRVHFFQDFLVRICKEGAMVMGPLLLADSSRDL